MTVSIRSRSARPAPGQKDKRRARRQDVVYPVTIENPADGSTTPCAIRDISATGARLGLKDKTFIPDEFVLRLSENRQASRRCRIVWRGDHTIGVHFVETDA